MYVSLLVGVLLLSSNHEVVRGFASYTCTALLNEMISLTYFETRIGSDILLDICLLVHLKMSFLARKSTFKLLLGK